MYKERKERRTAYVQNSGPPAPLLHIKNVMLGGIKENERERERVIGVYDRGVIIIIRKLFDYFKYFFMGSAHGRN